MSAVKTVLPFSLIFFSLFCFAQTPTIVTGRVLDKTTHTGLDYANVHFIGSFNGVNTDTFGNFKISSILKKTKIVASYIGFQPATIAIEPGKTTNLTIELDPVNINLKEVIVKPKRRKKGREIDTAALYIFHHVVENKNKNREEAIDGYHFNEYSKMVYSVLNPGDKFLNAGIFKPYKFFFERPDTNSQGKKFIPLFIQEELHETYYRKKPEKKVKIFHYNRMSGLKQPIFVKLIGYHFEVTDAYENVHIVLQKSFISPFSPGAQVVYNYHAIDTCKIDGRTSYKLNFVGRIKEDLCEKGYAWIDSATWAIKFLSYNPNEKANLNYIYNLQLDQTFNMVNDTQWLMTSQNLNLEGNLLKDPKKIAIRIEKITVRKDITLNVTAPDSVWKAKDNMVDADCYKKSLAYIDTMRLDTLSPSEKLVYYHFDTVRHVPAYKGLTEFLNFILTSNIKAGPVEFGLLYHVASRNNVEGWRLRMGVRTNSEVSDKFYGGFYGAYGTKDKQWKYGGNLRFLLPAKYDRWHAIDLEYINDMTVLGNEDSYATYDNILTLISGATLSRVMKLRALTLYYERDWIKGLSSIITLSNKTYYAIPGVFEFSKRDGAGVISNVPAITTSEISASLRWCKTDYFYESYTYRYPLQTRTPSIALQVNIGLKNKLFGGNYTYGKFSVKFIHRWQLPAIGYSKIMIRAGYTLGNSPYPVSYISSSNLSLVRDDLTFQSAAPFEFVSDKFLMVWWEHYFDGFFLNRIPGISKLHIREFIQCKALIGGYSAKNAALITLPAGMSVPGPVPYVEVGFGLENILKIFQVGFFFRCTYRDNPNAQNFGVKIGVYPGF